MMIVLIIAADVLAAVCVTMIAINVAKVVVRWTYD